ncbi:HupE/UreJ family protein [Alkalinema sp. FACHB-956]|uniref:HupE/UreJ family protein n=1 Tax=Alkalinema sp. FACHB-956 TaxID=2692768 RepID=UPI0016830971|nr:HupE/UreJ family protein [Alkalinema sp. FACHB-956]MBD2329146.1 HupE/UreJ family protein [Alkalinema sp. FACHB-956]
MTQLKVSRNRSLLPSFTVLSLLTGALLLKATPSLAHHAMGGNLPTTWFQGLMSGLAHPIIGPDHFAFIVAVGLLAAIKRQGLWLPVAFVVAAMLGTGLHLTQFNLPGVELFVSGSIVLFGALLVMKKSPNTGLVAVLTAIAGLFHGYAYGEAIFGAETTPFFAYLAGFTMIQLVISIATFWISHVMILGRNPEGGAVQFHSAGFVILGMGLAFLISQVMSLLFPFAAA